MNSVQERQASRNFRDKNGNLYLVRCYACEPERGRENYAMSVASGQCAWCGWKEVPPASR